jgi:hypothetical protein
MGFPTIIRLPVCLNDFRTTKILFTQNCCLCFYLEPCATLVSFLPIFSCFFKQNGLASGLELDLEKYVVPTPNMGSGVVYASNLTENPRSLVHTWNSSNNDTTKDILHNSNKGDASPDDYANIVKV